MNFIKVKELFEIKKGKKVEQIEAFKEGCIRYIQIDDLRNNNNIKFCNEEKSYIISNSDDIIIAWDGANAGTIGYGLVGAIGSTLAILRKKDNNFNTEYCGLFLKSKFNYLRDKCTGATIPHISRSSLEELRVPNIGVEEQKKIANILNLAQELIDKRKKQIEELDLLVKSKFIEMFGDPVKNPLEWQKGKIADIIVKTQYGTSNKADEFNGDFKVLRMNNITYDGNWDFTSIKYINLDEKEQKKYLVYKGEVLFNRTNSKELVGKTAVYKEDEPMAYAGYLVKAIPNEKANGEFISAYMNTKYVKDKLLNMAKNIVGMANINAEEFKKIDIYIPPIELQNQFADFVKQVDKLKFKMEFDLKELEYNFNSLMKKYFQN
ncbi:restriction endonuclease subunit S [Clostridium perfringens]|uniref:restriction endonuclease subunit S n=1 Tax=Clostridium perfringens TaxID=1502 RepID=UPI0013E3441A|nr:restriction endonuclease subunit S [Clostridium perfringens]NGS99908.1 restriction endonuclease [Clostridium perfringens]